MSKTQKTKIIALLSVVFITVLAVTVYLGVKYSMLYVRTALAEEQIVIFMDMRDRALQAEPKEAVGYLRYAVGYYPSGTKQVRGSALDRIVEQNRSEMIRQIIAHLHKKTGKDLGNDPGRWFREYGVE